MGHPDERSTNPRFTLSTPDPDSLHLRIHGHMGRADVRRLCGRLRDHLVNEGRRQIVCDVNEVAEPDLQDIDALARLQLVARREGLRIELRGASERLSELLILAGLHELLRGSDGGPLGQAE